MDIMILDLVIVLNVIILVKPVQAVLHLVILVLQILVLTEHLILLIIRVIAILDMLILVHKIANYVTILVKPALIILSIIPVTLAMEPTELIILLQILVYVTLGT